MRIFTKTRVAPDKDKDTPGEVMMTVFISPSINNSVLHQKTRDDAGTAGGADQTSGMMTEDSEANCNLNVPN